MNEIYLKSYHQPRLDMCYPTCVKVVLDSIVRHSNIKSARKLKLPLHSIAKLCGYRPGLGVQSDADAVDNLNRHIAQHGFIARTEIAPKSDINHLRSLLNNRYFPIVTISMKYFDAYTERDYKGDVGDYGHTVIISNVDDANECVYFFDPWQKYEEDTQFYLGGISRNNLKYPPFFNMWGEENNWVLWISPLKPRAEEYTGQENLPRWL